MGQVRRAQRITSRPCPRGQRLQEGQGCGDRNRHEGKTPTLLARVGLGLSLRQAGRGNGQVLHRLLARRDIAGSLHLRRKGLLVAQAQSANVPLSRRAGLVGLIAQGCPESYPLSSLSVDYRTWNCQQLANEADLLKDALAVAFEQRSDEHVAHLRANRPPAACSIHIKSAGSRERIPWE